MERKLNKDKFVSANIDYRIMNCRKNKTTFYRDFIVVNSSKADFCYDLYSKILNFDNDRFSSYMKKIKMGMVFMSSYK